MELKLFTMVRAPVLVVTFNQTNVELKPGSFKKTLQKTWSSFNQTNVELKHGCQPGCGSQASAFNQTNVELKQMSTTKVYGEVLPFNQTNVELKHRDQKRHEL